MPMVLSMGIRRQTRATEAPEQVLVLEGRGQVLAPEAPEQVLAPEASESEPDSRPTRRAPPRRWMARVLLSLFLVVGLAAAVAATWQWKNVQARQARQSFDQRASGVAAKVATALQRDTDLTTTSRALIEQNPNITNAQLGSLFSSLAPTAPANASGITYIEKVSSAQLYYYRVAIAADPTSALSAGEPFAITPSTAQAPYCLTRLLALRASLSSVGDVALPPGLDWCSTSANGALVSSRDFGPGGGDQAARDRRGSDARDPVSARHGAGKRGHRVPEDPRPRVQLDNRDGRTGLRRPHADDCGRPRQRPRRMGGRHLRCGADPPRRSGNAGQPAGDADSDQPREHASGRRLQRQCQCQRRAGSTPSRPVPTGAGS